MSASSRVFFGHVEQCLGTSGRARLLEYPSCNLCWHVGFAGGSSDGQY